VETVNNSSATSSTIFWYDQAGNVVEETTPTGVKQARYIYFNGARIVELTAGSTPTTYAAHYYIADLLGTARMLTDQTGTVCYDADYFPWGGEQYVATNTCSQNYKFTGKQRDPAMGDDYFGARYYKQDMARFYSPDWAAKVEPVPYAKLDNPQTLNLYSYVANNPESVADPDGHDFINGISGLYFSTQSSLIDLLGETGKMNSASLAAAVGFDTPIFAGDSQDKAKAAEQKTQNNGQVTVKVKGKTVTYTYPDGSKVVLKGTHAWRDNNPGDLKSEYGSIARARDGTFAIYPSAAGGWNALRNL
jgi:RHS repeat-associated protein